MQKKTLELVKNAPMGYQSTIQFVRERDKHTCQKCGRKRRNGERQLDVHHMNEHEGKDKEFKIDHKPGEMITLCRKCHLNLPEVRLKMSQGRKKT